MGLRSSLKRFLKSLWNEFKGSAREGYERGRYGAEGKPPRPRALSTDERFKQSSVETLAETQSRNTAAVPISAPPAPIGKEVPPVVDAEYFDPSTLSCEKFEVSVDACIDYVDKKGNETRRDITTEEVYEYEDGVLVIRAYCHRRKDYRTFVSKRIRHWVNSTNGKPVDISDLRKELRWYADLDLTYIALNLGFAHSRVLDFYIGKFTRNFHTSRSGRKYYRMPSTLDRKLIEWEFAQSTNTFRTERLTAEQKEEVKDLMYNFRREDGRKKCSGVDEGIAFLMCNSLKSSGLGTRRSVVSLAETLLEGMPEKASVVQVLIEDFLDPSFKISPTKERDEVVAKEFEEQQKRNAEEKRIKEIREYLKQQESEKNIIVADIKEESKEAEEELENVSKTSTAKSKKRRRVSRLTSELNAVRLIARNECQNQLLKNLEEGKMIFERAPFENEIRKRVCTLLTDKEMNKYADLLLLTCMMEILVLSTNGIRLGKSLCLIMLLRLKRRRD